MQNKFIGYFLAALFFLGCTSKDKDTTSSYNNLSNYRDYITEVSHGIVSARGDIRIVLNQPVNSWSAGDELSSKLLEISPRVKGKVVALDGRTIAFIPQDGFLQNTEYQYTLKLREILPEVPKEQATFTFGIKTLKQQVNVYTNPLQSLSKKLQYVEGQLRSADQLDLETAKKLLKVDRNGKQIKVTFNEAAKTGTLFQFRIDSIQRLKEDSELAISWDGNPYDISSRGSNNIKIPGLSNFSILQVSTDPSGSQQLAINFSDPLKKDQNFKGLVVLEGDDNPKFSVDRNVLKVYPSTEIKGTVLLEIFEGIVSEDGYKLKTKFAESVAFEQQKPLVRLLSNGTLLPSSHNLKVNFEAVNLTAVDVTVLKIYKNNILQFLQGNNLNGNYNLRAVARPIARKKIVLTNAASDLSKWQVHALDLRSLIAPEVGSMYRVEFNYGPSYSSYQCEATNFESFVADELSFDESQEDSSWDGIETYYEDYYDNYDWNERENPCHTSYYYDKKIGLNVLASDVGVTIKKGANKSYFIAVNDLLTTNPVAGAKVTFYNYQQQPIGDAFTEANGTALFDAEKHAFFAIAENNGQKTYVKLNDGNALSVSKFNVSGVGLQKGLKGFLFAERGVWRPGDDIYLSFILNDQANKLPKEHPVKMELFDPYNKVVRREVRTGGLNNFYHFPIKTDENAPTGNWLAKVSVGGASFTKTLKIETIKPNRLKIKTQFRDKVLSGGKPIQGTLDVTWLHGAVAKNLKTDITAKFGAQTTEFKTFPGYVFDDPTRAFTTEELPVFQGKVNEEGKANFTLNPQLSARAPGMLNASFITKVYEQGGDFSTDVFSKEYAPYDTYVGLNVPKGDKTRGMLLTDTKHRFEVVTVNVDGHARANRNLKVTIHKVNWRWWWDTSPDNLSEFSSSNYREKVFEQDIRTGSDGKASFDFELKYPNWGRYLVRVSDENGGHATGKAIYIDWPGWAGKSRKNDPSAATMLLFSTDKETYQVQENAVITFPSSEGGRALVTVENGSEVLESLWIEPSAGETKFTLPIKELYTPNVFIHISLLQPHANSINDAPIRLYGVVPVGVENSKTKLQPEIQMPEVLAPEKEVTIKVSEQQKRKMTYSLAIVDDGLLDLTRFSTPDPWNTFYAREALGVKTWDVYDDVIGAFGGRINQVFAIGGDGSLAAAKNKKANRFDPMVLHLGPFELNPGQTRSHKIKVPKYIGSVRTMVIAENPETEAYGAAEKTTPVRKPLMILASLPRKITPGEKVTLPVTVFAMEKKVKNVTVKLKPNKAFIVDGPSSKAISFSNPDEKMVYFDLQVSDLSAIGKVEVEASGNGETASYEVPIDVFNPNTPTSKAEHFVLDANTQKVLDLETFGIEGSNEATIELSTLPPMNFNGRMNFLIRYPHGCVEQTTSAAFPQLYLADIFDLPVQKKQQVQKHVENAIHRLGGHQLPNGGFSYWPGQARPNDWGTSFAGHFLLEAAEKGYVLPIGFKDSWVRYQQQTSKQWRSGTGHSDLAQAYRLYTLALAGNADVAAMNRLRETSALSDEAKIRLASAYALIGQTGVAKQLFQKASLNFNNKTHDYYTYGSATRNRAMALETLVHLGDKAGAQELAKTLAQKLNENRWMSTQSTAYSLLAMGKFAAMVGGKGVKAAITVNGSSENVNTKKTLAAQQLVIRKGTNAITVKNEENNTLYVTLVNSGILPVGEEQPVKRNLSATVSFKGRDGKRLEISQLVQGTNFVAEVTLSNSTSRNVKDMALTTIFPSGWEIVNTRFTDFGDFAENQATHTDVRDDRVNFYFDLKRNETKVFKVLLNASYLGTYYLPGVQAEAMYDSDYLVRTSGKWVDVIQ